MRGDVLEVSALYEANAELFPDEASLRRHIADYADPVFAVRVQGASRIKADVKDYYIADLFQGVVNDTNPNEGSPAVFASAPGEAQIFFDARGQQLRSLKAPIVAMDYLKVIREKKAAREGQVSVEEYVASEEEAKPDE